MLYSLRKFFIIGSLTKNVISDWLFVIYDWHRLLHAVLMFLDIPTLRTMGNLVFPDSPLEPKTLYQVVAVHTWYWGQKEFTSKNLSMVQRP
jgi:hypothetical protein